ncbi:MAG TPA: hypothetical protein VGS23_03940, partial [Thermoplasmata archaeon]|nr:hypothetical protein [Thermoplasmata archaeon]
PSNVSVTFAPETYGVTFVETGLPVGTNWSVTLGGTRSSTTGTADRFVEVNGTYPEEISPIPGWRTPSPSGNVTVSGTAVRETVVWSPEVYPVEFVEKGLPTGTGWWVNVTETPSVFSAGTNVSVNETNGTYAYAVVSSDPSYSAAGGSFSVQGTGVLETLDFAVVTYAIVFSELGLPLGTTWSVVVEGSSWMSSAASITVREGNGSYGFSVPGIAGFSPSPGSGTVTVVGASVNQTVLFLVVAPTTYTVTFTESGLASGSEWSVTLNGTTKSSTGAVEFPGVQNGTYRFTVEGVGRSVPTPSSGQVTINGSPVHRSVVFPGPVSAPSTLVGLTPAEGVELVTGVAAIAGVCGFIGLSARRQRRRRDRPMGRVPGPPQKGS